MHPGCIQSIHKKGCSGKWKVFMKLRPTDQAVGMTKRMGRKIKYEK